MIGDFVVALAAIVMFCSALYATGQKNIKTLLSYSAISQFSYALAGIGLAGRSVEGLTGGVFHIINLAAIMLLFYVAVINLVHRTGTYRSDMMQGLSGKMPFTCWSFIAATFALAGFPPFNGFVSGHMIVEGLINVGSTIMAVAAFVIILTRVLILAYLLRFAHRVFFGQALEKYSNLRESRLAEVVMLLLVAVCIFIGIWPDSVLSILGTVIPR